MFSSWWTRSRGRFSDMSIGLVMTTTTKSTTTNESNSSRSCSTLIRSLVSSSFSLIIRRHSNSCLSEHHHHHHHPNNGGSRSHHRHYRSRCHHPFLPNWSSNLIQLYILFILLINTVYNYNTSIDDDIISHGQGIQRTNSFSDNDSEPRNTSIRLVNVNNNNNKDKNNAPYVIEEYGMLFLALTPQFYITFFYCFYQLLLYDIRLTFTKQLSFIIELVYLLCLIIGINIDTTRHITIHSRPVCLSHQNCFDTFGTTVRCRLCF